MNASQSGQHKETPVIINPFCATYKKLFVFFQPSKSRSSEKIFHGPLGKENRGARAFYGNLALLDAENDGKIWRQE